MSDMAFEAHCPAKVNLSLRVGARREDGYHELRTVFQAVDLWDSLFARDAEQLTVACDDPAVPTDASNLVLRAAEALRRHTGTTRGAELWLRKRIPAGGGMGGGSSDAAGAILLLDRLWELGLRPEEREAIAAPLGADVPFFLHGGTALGEGRGERLSPLPFAGERKLLLGLPPFGISTAEVYAAFDRDLTPRGKDVSFQRSRLGNLPKENDFGVGDNDLEGVVFARWPVLREFRDELLREGASKALLSGSGSTVFGWFDDSGALREATARLAPRFERWRLLESRTVASGVRVVEAGWAD